MPFLPHQCISICTKSLLNSLGYLPNRNMGGGRRYSNFSMFLWSYLSFLQTIFYFYILLVSWSNVPALQFHLSASTFKISWILHTNNLSSYSHNNTAKRRALGSHHFQVESSPAEKCSSWQQQVTSIVIYMYVYVYTHTHTHSSAAFCNGGNVSLRSQWILPSWTLGQGQALDVYVTIAESRQPDQDAGPLK